jgi:hypothetical protein
MTTFLTRVARALNSEWLEALANEAGECASGRSRTVWLLGGVRVLTGTLVRRYGLMTLIFSAAIAAVLALGLPGSSTDPAVVRNRTELPLLLTALALLPVLARRWFGPVRPERSARAMRVLGYLALLALMTPKAIEARDGLRLGNYFQIQKIGPLQLALGLLIVAYAVVLLYATSPRVPLRPRSLTLAVVAGALAGAALFLRYGVSLWSMNLGWLGICFVAVPALVGFAGARLAPRARVPTRHGAAAAVITGLTAALVLAVLAASAVAISPDLVPLQPPPCQPCTAPHRYLVEWSILKATTPASLLLVGAPLIALCAGTCGASLLLLKRPRRATTVRRA